MAAWGIMHYPRDVHPVLLRPLLRALAQRFGGVATQVIESFLAPGQLLYSAFLSADGQLLVNLTRRQATLLQILPYRVWFLALKQFEQDGSYL